VKFLVKRFALIAATLLLFIEVFCIKLVPVLKETFPLDKFEAVMYTITQSTDGSQAFIYSLIWGVFKDSLVPFGIIAIAICLAVFFIKKLNYSRAIAAANLLGIAYIIYVAFTQLPIIDYALAWEDLDALPEHSEFYQKEYVNPDSVEIKFKEKRNLILIFLESMEYNFQDSANGGNLHENLIPEITNYIKTEQSFLPGGAPAFGMGWTMAAVVSKTCGIPLNLPPTIAKSYKPLKSFLPGATCLTDILKKNDFKVLVTKGANLKFSGMNDFLETHSKPQAIDLMTYTKDPRVTPEMLSEWGLRDSLHYEFVKEHISRLKGQEKPWALWMFTVDTHTPYGYVDPTCEIPEGTPESKQFPYVVKCASRQVDRFIKWAKAQEWFENTTIAVMGDHAYMADPKTAGITEMGIHHYWLDFFINSTVKHKGGKRKFTSLDMYPTILESIGASIPNGSLGLGRSLYSKEPTLLEKYGADSLNNAMKKNSLEYNYFLYAER